MAQLFVFFVIGAALISGTNAQNILNTFSSLFGTSRLKFGGGGGGDDIFKQFLDNPNQLSALLGGRSGGLNFDSILKTFQPPAGGDEQSLPDIATLLKNGLTDVVGIASGNQSRVNGTTANSSRSRPTLSSAESESEGIPI
uniref:Uncharacterized protein n=1 Tax=Plectus sambesii TaxID=2011161 RepID=A0A914USK5_9BILA